MNDLTEVIKLLRDTHASLLFSDVADALTPVAEQHYLVAISQIQQSIYSMQLADLEQTRELAKGRA